MSLLCCSQFPPQVLFLGKRVCKLTSIGTKNQSIRSINREIVGHAVFVRGRKVGNQRSFLGRSEFMFLPDLQKNAGNSKCFTASASWLTSTQIASNAFTWGTVAVLPFYALMILAPSAALVIRVLLLTRRTIESNFPFVMLGVLYTYLLYLSWRENTLRLMFASKYWLPELTGILKMFMNEMTMASAWIHLLAVDLYAARHIFLDGLKNCMETRHSISLCLFFCPIGIITHIITKLMATSVCSSH
ncbi:hypothetical protein AXF42_Ash003795 [Apostasia shenzhenica]|uniref:Protein ABA DEFICIENT 4, chloroplastic-like n=1 Tax=Apostasia shenzhenica TaxID=1088818 RepID=A0A2I0AHZ3_9ASPA|nr:hypothetical protein AXF42_Ash003795 [Apostasia shenzhenica]